MSRADYYVGLTIEGDESLLKLTIDGRRVKGVKKDKDGLFYDAYDSERPKVGAKTLYELGRQIIDRSPDLKNYREGIRDFHVEILKRGVDHWNRWRRKEPETRPLLFGADLRAKTPKLPNLKSVDFANANLIEADLRDRDLTGANFHEANLGGAKLHKNGC